MISEQREEKKALYKKASKKLKACKNCHTIYIHYENYCYSCHSKNFITEGNKVAKILFGYFENRVLN